MQLTKENSMRVTILPYWEAKGRDVEEDPGKLALHCPCSYGGTECINVLAKEAADGISHIVGAT